jgi:bud site selection protein 31
VRLSGSGTSIIDTVASRDCFAEHGKMTKIFMCLYSAVNLFQPHRELHRVVRISASSHLLTDLTALHALSTSLSQSPSPVGNMAPIRTTRNRKRPPEGFADIEDDLLIFANKMKDAQNKPPPPGPKHQAQWEIFQISHQRSRYVYDLYYEKEAISKPLYEWLLKNGYADAMLIAKWKKQGYEKVRRWWKPVVTTMKSLECAANRVFYFQLCCLRCVQTKETNFNSTCICRVPRAQMKEDQEIQCVNCGCRGCASSD